MQPNSAESHPVVVECAEQRAQPPAPYTVADAVHDAKHLRKVPECILGDAQAKRVIDTLLAALESSPCFLNAVVRGQRVFCLVEQDRCAPIGIRAWAESAGRHGAPIGKVQGAVKTAHDFENSKVPRKFPD